MKNRKEIRVSQSKGISDKSTYSIFMPIRRSKTHGFSGSFKPYAVGTTNP